MRYDRAAILTDLDGTLFNSDGEVSAEDRVAVREFIDGGGLFGVATGREPHNARRWLPALSLNAPSIVLNGAAVYDFVRQCYLQASLVDKEAACDVIQRCERLGLSLDIQIYTTEGIFYASPLEVADPGFLQVHQPTAFLPMEQLAQKDWVKILFLEREAGALAPLREILRQTGDRLSLVEGTTDVVKVGKYQELLPRSVNKGSGVAVLRQLPVYENRVLFAVGDYWNDMELLQAVDIPCAPTNAIDEVRAVCRHILPSHNDSPIAELIRRVIPSL